MYMRRSSNGTKDCTFGPKTRNSATSRTWVFTSRNQNLRSTIKNWSHHNQQANSMETFRKSTPPEKATVRHGTLLTVFDADVFGVDLVVLTASALFVCDDRSTAVLAACFRAAFSFPFPFPFRATLTASFRSF